MFRGPRVDVIEADLAAHAEGPPRPQAGSGQGVEGVREFDLRILAILEAVDAILRGLFWAVVVLGVAVLYLLVRV